MEPAPLTSQATERFFRLSSCLQGTPKTQLCESSPGLFVSAAAFELSLSQEATIACLPAPAGGGGGTGTHWFTKLNLGAVVTFICCGFSFWDK